MRGRSSAWIIGLLVVGALALGVVWLAARQRDEPAPARAVEDGDPATGGGPAAGRLRDGARQVGDPATARAVAREALVRVESELAATDDPGEMRRLERKRELVLRALERFDDGRSP